MNFEYLVIGGGALAGVVLMAWLCDVPYGVVVLCADKLEMELMRTQADRALEAWRCGWPEKARRHFRQAIVHATAATGRMNRVVRASWVVEQYLDWKKGCRELIAEYDRLGSPPA